MDRTHCTICQEPLTHDNTAACQCGHTFHYHCILAWYERSKTCPQCRKTFRNAPIRLYFDVPDGLDELDWGTLKTQLSECNAQILQHASVIRKKDAELKALQLNFETVSLDLQEAKNELERSKSNCAALKRQLGLLEKMKDEVSRYKGEARDLRATLTKLNSVQMLVDGERRDVEEMLKGYSDRGDRLDELATSFIILKKEFERLKDHKDSLLEQKKSSRRNLEELKQKLMVVNIDKKKAEERFQFAESDLQAMELECQHLREKLMKAEERLTSDTPRTLLLKRQMKESPAHDSVKTPKTTSPEQPKLDQGRTSRKRQLHCSQLSPSSASKQKKKNGDTEDLLEELGLLKVNICEGLKAPLKPSTRTSKFAMPPKTTNEAPTDDAVISITNTYNGLGGRSRMLNFQKRKISNVRIPKKRKAVNANHPPLPSLETFFSS